MAIKWLEPDEKPEVFWHSSISQEKHTLSVMKRGEWVPISFDSLDYIKCNETDGVCGGLKAVSHCAIVTDKPDIGYKYKVGDCKYLSKVVLTSDHFGVVTKALPAWMGEGTYEAYESNRAFVNSDCASLGIIQETNLRVGTAYALARHTLPAED
jgi:hypothetical protein